MSEHRGDDVHPVEAAMADSVANLDKVAAAIWPEIGTDYTWTEALDGASGKLTDDDHSQRRHLQAIEYARDLARAALAAIAAMKGYDR
tara:strand:+ start:339 stop:602 length:264 start_codon:yes stop_codon:yes gene_type:complete